MPELSAVVNVAYGINAVVVENESLKLATGRETLYGNWTGRGKGTWEEGREGRERGKKYFKHIIQCMYLYVNVHSVLKIE